MDAINKKEISSLSCLMTNLAAVFVEYTEKGKIDIKFHHLVNECLKDVLRFEKDENKSKLMKAADNKPLNAISDFFYSLSLALAEFSESNSISLNRQTDLKTKVKEILNLGA